MMIEVLLFAAARELTGRDAVQIEVRCEKLTPMQHETTAAVNGGSGEGESLGNDNAACVLVSGIRQALKQQCPELKQLLPSCRIAVDCEYVGPEVSVPLGAEVALIPPVSGG